MGTQSHVSGRTPESVYYAALARSVRFGRGVLSAYLIYGAAASAC